MPTIKPNLLDRAIAAVSPVRGARRLRARAFLSIMGSYTGARTDRKATETWRTANNSADADILYDLPKLRDRSRDLARNAPIAGGAITTVVQNVVGTGLSLKSRPDATVLGMSEDEAAEWAANTQKEFELYAESPNCDLTRTQNFYGLQDLTLRSWAESGDVLVTFPFVPVKGSPYALRIQVIEGDRLETPFGVVEGGKAKDGNIIAGGVELDANGAPVAYHILEQHPGSLAGRTNRKSQRIDAFGQKTGRRNVVHLFARTRPGQNRGVPMLAPVIEPLKQLTKYAEAELDAAVVSSLFTVFVKTPDGMGLTDIQGTDDKSQQDEIKLGTGSILDLAPGEEIQMAGQNRPNQAFDAFVLSLLRQIGVGLGLPFEVLIKHFTASYSAARAALMEAWRFYRLRREFLAAGFCDPVYEAWMEEAVALGRIDAPGFFDDPALRRAYLKSEWLGDAPPQIDPVKEVDAASKRIELKVSTHEEETMFLTGGNFEEKVRQQAREKKLMQDAGLNGQDPRQTAAHDQATGGNGSDLEKPEDAA